MVGEFRPAATLPSARANGCSGGCRFSRIGSRLRSVSVREDNMNSQKLNRCNGGNLKNIRGRWHGHCSDTDIWTPNVYIRYLLNTCRKGHIQLHEIDIASIERTRSIIQFASWNCKSRFWMQVI